MREQFVVYTQSLDDDGRVGVIYGPFDDWSEAVVMCERMQLQADDNHVWVGVRQLIPPPIKT